MLNEILQLASLTSNEKALLQYNFYYAAADYLNARLSMEGFSPDNSDEADYKFLRLSDLDAIANQGSALPENTMLKLGEIENKKSNNSNFAISLLNNSPTYRDYIFEEQTLLDVVKGINVQHVAEGESSLKLSPNPARDKVFVEVVNSGMIDGQIRIMDANGKQISDYKLDFVAGGIEIDIHNLRNGLYFVTLTDQNSGFIQTGKLVKN